MLPRMGDDLVGLKKAVMEAVWSFEEATVQQVRERLKRRPPLAYTTVLSVMQKLEKAGWLTHRSEGRTYVYKATRSREQAGSSSVRSFINRAFQGDPLRLFQHLINDEALTQQDLAAIRKMIDERRGGTRDD